MAISIDVEKKPNAVACECTICEKEIKKGKVRIAIRSHSFRRSDALYFHIPCIIRFLSTELAKFGKYKSKKRDFVKGISVGMKLVED